MGYRHYLYAVPKKQVAEIQACKTNEDWCNFAERHDYQYDEDDGWLSPYKVGKELYELGKYSEIGFKLESERPSLFANVPHCWGTKEKDICNCGGDKSKCNFYRRVRAETVEENSFLTTKNALEEIEDLIEKHWGTDPAYYTGSENKEEADAAKLCCKILEAIRMAQGEIDEENS